MNIFDLSAADTATVNLVHPATGKPLLMPDGGGNMHVVVYGQDSKHFKQLKSVMNKSLLERIPNAGEGYVPTDEDIAIIDELNRDLLQGCVQSILYEGPDGASTDIDAFFESAPDMIVEQIDEAVGSRANFMQA